MERDCQHVYHRKHIFRDCNDYGYVCLDRYIQPRQAYAQNSGKRQPISHHQQRNRYGGFNDGVLHHVRFPRRLLAPYHRTHSFLQSICRVERASKTRIHGSEHIRSGSRPRSKPLQSVGESHDPHHHARHRKRLCYGVYHVYGRDITSSLIQIDEKTELFEVTGFIGKPNVSRGNRNYENYFINGRYIKSALLSKAIEEGYKGFMMQHQYPFCVLYIQINSELIDVNVHPTKMELRFTQNETIYNSLYQIVRNALTHREFIQQVPVTEEKKQRDTVPEVKTAPEPFEVRRLNDVRKAISLDSPYERKYPDHLRENTNYQNTPFQNTSVSATRIFEKLAKDKEVFAKTKQSVMAAPKETQKTVYEQQQLDTAFLTADARKQHKIIGQLFDTYWLVEYEDKLFIIDQHAAHEKVLYEKTMEKLKEKSFTSQAVSPPIILTLNNEETEMLEKYKKELNSFGYEIEPFGGKEYAITAIPAEFSDVDMKSMFIEMLDDFANIGGAQAPVMLMEKVASMSCKAAVKGHDRLSTQEASHLIDTLLTLENPYQCPHGRPTIIAMSKFEIEKKFKRIV